MLVRVHACSSLRLFGLFRFASFRFVSSTHPLLTTSEFEFQNFAKASRNFKTQPKASECIRMRPNRWEWVKTRLKTCKNIKNLHESFETNERRIIQCLIVIIEESPVSTPNGRCLVFVESASGGFALVHTLFEPTLCSSPRFVRVHVCSSSRLFEFICIRAPHQG